MKRPLADNVHGYARNNWHVNGGYIAPLLIIGLSVQARWIASPLKMLTHTKTYLSMSTYFVFYHIT